MTRNIFRWEIFLQTKFRLLVTKYFITESQFSCSGNQHRDPKIIGCAVILSPLVCAWSLSKRQLSFLKTVCGEFYMDDAIGAW